SPMTASDPVANPTAALRATTRRLATSMTRSTRRTARLRWASRSAACTMLPRLRRRPAASIGVHRAQDGALEVAGLRHGQELGVVGGLAQQPLQPEPAAAVGRGGGEHLEESGPAHVERAGG